VVDFLTLRAGDAPAQVLRQVSVDRLLSEIGDLALGVGVDESACERNTHGNGDVLLGHAGLGENTGGSDEVLVERPGCGVAVLGLAVEEEDAVGTVQSVARSLDVACVLVGAAVVGAERGGVALERGGAGGVSGRSAVAARVDDLGADCRGGARGVGDVSRDSSSGRILVRAAQVDLDVCADGGEKGGDDSSADNILKLVEHVLAVGLRLRCCATLGGTSGGGGAGAVQPVDLALDGARAAVGVGEFGVGVLEDRPVADLVGGPEVAVGVPVERRQGRVGILSLAGRNGPGGVRSVLGTTVRVRVDSLPEREETVNHHVVKPEARVECGSREVSHVASRGGGRARATKSRVDGVVNALERV